MTDADISHRPQLQNRGETLVQRGWCMFCRLLLRIFYGRREARGLERIPARGPVLLCANHPNAIADAIVIQGFCPRLIHPLVRSLTFDNPLARPWLHLMQAVPIYRREDLGVDLRRNVDSFALCYEHLAHGDVLLIFPEGQTHSDPHMRELRTGAARIARGSLETTGTEPTVLPVGVNFMDKGEFRGSVYVQVGEAINLSVLAKENPKDTVRRLTALIESALNAVTLSAESVEDLELSRRLERFFALRRGRYRHATLEQRVRALKKLLEWRQLLRERDPKRVAALSRQLDRFDRLCRHFGVRDYQLTLRYSPVVIARFVLRTLLILAVILPLGLWGWVNSAFPYVLTRVLVRRQSVELQDRDFRRMEYGSILFLGAWAIQSAIVGGLFGPVAAVAYLLSLPPAFAAALALQRERSRISENIHWFFLLLRKRSLRDFLLAHRKELEKELAQMTRLLKHQPN